MRCRLEVKGYRLRIDFGCIPLLATGFTAARDIPQTDVGYTTERETDKPQDDIVDTTSIWLVSRRAAVLQRTYGKRSLRSAAVGGDTSSSIGGIAVALFVAKKVQTNRDCYENISYYTHRAGRARPAVGQRGGGVEIFTH